MNQPDYLDTADDIADQKGNPMTASHTEEPIRGTSVCHRRLRLPGPSCRAAINASA